VNLKFLIKSVDLRLCLWSSLAQKTICVQVNGGEGWFMNLESKVMNSIPCAPDAVRLICLEGQVNLQARELEDVIKDIATRATEVGPVLEGILHEPHTEAHGD
jgi:hypothetical protein